MRKFLLLSFCLLCAFANAQVMQMKPTTAVTVAGVTAAYDSVVAAYPAQKCASFQVNITRVSTAMYGKIQLQGSDDGGMNWVNTSAADTVHISDAAAQSSVVTIAPATGMVYSAYRVYVTSISGDTMTVKSWANFRQ